VRTVGIDMAAEPRKTASAVVEWRPSDVVVTHLTLNCSDADIIGLVGTADKAGIDCPLGWPEPFVDFVLAHREGRPLAPTDLAARRHLVYRATDLALIAQSGARPLSVAADLIGHTAMRVAGILSALAAGGCAIDRAGSGIVVEAYPAAALRAWGIYRPRYKGPSGITTREAILSDLRAALPQLRIDADQLALCHGSDDALDAIVCAMIARAAAIGRVTTPDAEQARVAKTEGWIVVPNGPLGELAIGTRS